MEEEPRQATLHYGKQSGLVIDTGMGEEPEMG